MGGANTQPHREGFGWQYAPGEPYTPPEPEPEPEMADLVVVTDFIPNLSVELKYATEDNFTHQVIYDFHTLYLRYGTVKKLAQAQRELNELGYGLLVWDGFRPVSAQWVLWQVCPDPAFVSHPERGRRAHCRGNAVDLTLIDLSTGQEVEMPTGFDSFTPRADRDYSDCTQASAEHALLLEEIMERCGFVGYSAEWWHFTDTDDYPVEESFEQ